MTSSLLNEIFAYKGEDIDTNIRKFAVGRILQAGWFSETEVKSEAIRRAFSLIPTIRTQFLEEVQYSKHKSPKIMGDFLTIWMSDNSFRSFFLEEELKEYLTGLFVSGDSSELRTAALVLFTLKPLLSFQEVKGLAQAILAEVEKLDFTHIEDKASAMMMLAVLQQKDYAAHRAILTQINKLQKQYPDIFKILIPDSPGFRRIPQNRQKAIGAKKKG